jgi:hypothetical protein
MSLGCAFALLPLWAAHAEPSAGEISVSLPSRIVLDGSAVPVSVSTSGVDHALDVVAVGLYDGSDLQAMGGVVAGGSGDVGSSALSPGTLVARAAVATAGCDDTAADGCEVDAAGNHYRVVDGLVRHDSAAAVARYGSKVSLRVARTGTEVRWTAHAKRWNGSGWVDWSQAAVRIGTHTLQSNGRGVAVLTTRTKKSHTLVASVAGTTTVWSATSRRATSTAGSGAGAATAAERKSFRKVLEGLAG